MSELFDLEAREREQRYLRDHVMTATPQQRLFMLLYRLRSDLDHADEAFATMDRKQINTHLVHAQQILFALRDPLDRTTEFGRRLGDLYEFCVQRLILANLHKDPSLVAAVRESIDAIIAANERAAGVGAA